MAAALECWSGRPSTDDDRAEQVLMKDQDRSEAFPSSSSASSSSAASSPSRARDSSSSSAAILQAKKWQRLGRNFASVVATLKNSLAPDAPPRDASPVSADRMFWGDVIRNLTQLYPGSQLPEKLISNVRRHFDSLPKSYSQAGFDIKEVLLHVRLVEQTAAEEYPAIHVQELPEESGPEGAVLRLAFACTSSWPAVSAALDGSSFSCKRVQVFEKKGVTLGVAAVLVHPGGERQFKSRIESALRSATKKSRNSAVKLPFGFCGCQEESSRSADDDASFSGEDSDIENGHQCRIHLSRPLLASSIIVSFDEWQTIRSASDHIDQWLLSSEELQFGDRLGPNTFRGFYKGKRVHIKKLRGCERGSAYEIEIKQDLLQLMSCGQKNILRFYGICIEESHGLCVVTRMKDGGSVHDAMQKTRKIPVRDVMRVALDVAEALMFVNDHGVAYRDLNTHKILLDRQGNACIGDMGIVAPCKNAGEVTEYETAGYRWLAPEIIAGDPESVTETWMSNVYSFGMVIWEMVTGEVAYSSYSPVQAAVGIAACGLRPDIPKDCPLGLRSLMMRCWNNSPTKRPQFCDIISTITKNINR